MHLHRAWPRRFDTHFDFRTRTDPRLPDCDRDRRPADHQDSPPDAALESIDQVMRATAQGPHRWLEPERWPRLKRERKLCHRRPGYSISLSGIFCGEVLADPLLGALDALAAGWFLS